MHKIYIVSASDNVVEILNQYGLINTPRPQRAVRERDMEEIIRGTGRNRPRPTDEPADRYCNLVCQIFLSKDEALDAINELSRQNMNKKWYLLESVAFVEVPPTQPVMKQWNTEGELQLGT